MSPGSELGQLAMIPSALFAQLLIPVCCLLLTFRGDPLFAQLQSESCALQWVGKGARRGGVRQILGLARPFCQLGWCPSPVSIRRWVFSWLRKQVRKGGTWLCLACGATSLAVRKKMLELGN